MRSMFSCATSFNEPISFDTSVQTFVLSRRTLSDTLFLCHLERHGYVSDVLWCIQIWSAVFIKICYSGECLRWNAHFKFTRHSYLSGSLLCVRCSTMPNRSITLWPILRLRCVNSILFSVSLTLFFLLFSLPLSITLFLSLHYIVFFSLFHFVYVFFLSTTPCHFLSFLPSFLECHRHAVYVLWSIIF